MRHLELEIPIQFLYGSKNPVSTQILRMLHLWMFFTLVERNTGSTWWYYCGVLRSTGLQRPPCAKNCIQLLISTHSRRQSLLGESCGKWVQKSWIDSGADRWVNLEATLASLFSKLIMYNTDVLMCACTIIPFGLLEVKAHYHGQYYSAPFISYLWHSVVHKCGYVFKRVHTRG